MFSVPGVAHLPHEPLYKVDQPGTDRVAVFGKVSVERLVFSPGR
jgi:hypothetical protein